MSRNRHLLDSFHASEETLDLAGVLLRKAETKTAPGSGYDVGGLSTGLPAACVLLASERLNNGDVKHKSAQIASCLRPQDFQKVYDLAKLAIEEVSIGYDHLHQKYKTTTLEPVLNPFLLEIEREFRKLNKHTLLDELTIKCVVYFWVCSSAKVRTMPKTEIYASGESVPSKKFITLAHTLNDFHSSSRTKIRESVLAFQAKRATATTVASSSKQAQDETEPQTPLRRSQRTTTPLTSPTKSIARSIPISPVKITQPTVVPSPWKKVPLREMPSKDTPKKDSPKKRPVDDVSTNIEADIEMSGPPNKKRKEDLEPVTPTKPTLRSSSAAHSRPQQQLSPTKKKATPFPKTSSPLKPVVETAPDKLIDDESDDGEENEFQQSSRRFRPIYLDFKQWNARDPRLDKMWKRLNKTLTETSSRHKPTKKGRA